MGKVSALVKAKLQAESEQLSRAPGTDNRPHDPAGLHPVLLGRVDIVDVVDRHVKLKKAGANFQACCPFHNEKTPSFSVSPTKQFYHCFGCGAHGNAIGFLMEYSGLAYPEAIRSTRRDGRHAGARDAGPRTEDRRAAQAPRASPRA